MTRQHKYFTPSTCYLLAQAGWRVILYCVSVHVWLCGCVCDCCCLVSGVKRLNLGGKALTNLLKETVSYRSLDMRDEGLLMEQLKEQLSWVSQVGGSKTAAQRLTFKF